MIYRLYEYALSRALSDLPGKICFMITAGDLVAAPRKVLETVMWCDEWRTSPSRKGIDQVTFHVSTSRPADVGPCLPVLREIGEVARFNLLCGKMTEKRGEGLPVMVAIGYSGRDEIAGCIRKMAENGVRSSEVDETVIEQYLTFQYAPDLVIKTGGDHLTDFLIWQSVYSELFFSDVNWPSFRKVDFIRALRDYQSRSRRFGV